MRSRSPLTGCQVTSRPRDRFSRYSKWLDTFRTALVCASSNRNYCWILYFQVLTNISSVSLPH
jgi:hypothetical protein